MRIASIFFVLGIIWNFQATAYEKLEKGHVHEAFMNNEAGVTLLTAIPTEPPAPLKENKTDQTDPQTIWVDGYWEWSFDRSEYVWCSGGWRRPPVDHEWISGNWEKLEAGWVRVKGFWSKTPESKLSYIKETPPDAYDENPTNSPGKEYFWMSGYWKHKNNKYTWFSGKWEKLDKEWIYVPAKYIWRPSGYVFVPAFWDWPLDQRGIAYACVAVSPQETEITYYPGMQVDPWAMMEGCIPCYPDYCYMYYYYWFFYPDWWVGCDWCPPWWGWADWWWMPWFDHWGIWWWWTHPGFPAPWWFDLWLLNMLFGPPMPLINAMDDFHPPVILGPNGLIPPARLIDEAGGEPVFPLDPRDIQEEAGEGIDQGTTERPKGPHKPNDELDEDAPKPPQTTPPPPTDAPTGEQPSTPSEPTEPSEPGTVETPTKPTVPSTPPPTYQPPRRPVEPPRTYTPRPSRPIQPPSYQPQRPQRPPAYQPPSRPIQPPSYQPQRPIQPSYPSRPPSYQPQRPPQSEIPQTRPPSHNYVPQRPQSTPQIRPYQPQTIQPSQPSRPPSSTELY